jgi:molecular chaperone HscB
MDYFALFGLPRRLALDVTELQARFYKLSREWHPDRYQLKSPEDKQRALDMTSALNDGLRILRDPVARAEYVLKGEGFDIGEQRSKDVPAELLEEVFELNMALEELRSGDPAARPQLEEALAKFLSLRQDIDDQLQELFARWDQTQDRGVLAEIRALLNRRRYVRNLIQQAEEALNVHVSN